MQRTLLVTGGNRGIGYSIVIALAKNPEDRILLGCRNPDTLSSLPNNVTPVKLDLSSMEILEQDLVKLEKHFPQIDGLVNNAGVLISGDVLECSPKDFSYSLQVNVLAPYRLIRHVLPRMVERNYGRIVNLSSGWGSFHEGLAGPFAYSSTKAFINALTLTVSRGLPRNVKINSMCPGWVRTKMGGPEAPRSSEQGAETAIWLCNLGEDGPSGGFFRDKKRIDW